MKNVEIYTDGICKRSGEKDSIGGYGISLNYKDYYKEIVKIKKNTDNSEMELKSIITALKSLLEPCNVKIYSKCEYIIKSINDGRLAIWRENDWKTINNWKRTKKDLANKELWIELNQLMEIHNVQFIYVKKKEMNNMNKRVNWLANKAIKTFIKTGEVDSFFSLDF